MFAAVVFDAYGTLYDTDSLASACEKAFPGKGEIISQTWRQKQLQYSWLRTIMKRYADFETFTADALGSTQVPETSPRPKPAEGVNGPLSHPWSLS